MTTAIASIKKSKSSSTRSSKPPEPPSHSEIVTAEQMRRFLSLEQITGDAGGSWPKFEMIDKEELCVDEAYQRLVNKKLVFGIANSFNKYYFMACIVAERPNGTFALLDAQQRWAASLLRNDIKKLPCLVFKFNDLQDEANVFRTINKVRRSITPAEAFKAAIAQGDKDAIEINRVVEELGVFSIHDPSSANEFACVGALTSIYRKHAKPRPSHLSDLMLLLSCLEKNGAASFRTKGYVVHAISDLIDGLYGRRSSPDLDSLRRIFSGIDFNELINEVDADFNGRKIGSNPSKRIILRDKFISIIKLQAKGK